MVTMNNFETVIVYLFQITTENTYLINIAGLFLVPNAVFISWKAEITHFHFKVLAQNNRLLWLGSFLLHQTGSFISWKQKRRSRATLHLSVFYMLLSNYKYTFSKVISIRRRSSHENCCSHPVLVDLYYTQYLHKIQARTQPNVTVKLGTPTE